MPRSVPQAELDAIYTLVAAYPDGIAIDEISRAMRPGIPRRTLQRRLALLVEQRRLVTAGAGRGCRYQVPSAERPAKDRPLGRERALEILSRLKPVLAKRFGVNRLSLFGSTARDTAGADSDIDIVVAFDGPATSNRYFGVQFMLEDELGRPVDLVTQNALRKELRPAIEREAVDV